MTLDQMREEITTVYPGPNWKLSVQGMSDRQVVAVYKKFLETGKFEDKFRRTRKKGAEPPCEQITIFDLLKKGE